MRTRTRLGIVSLAGLVAGAVTDLLDGNGHAGALVLLGAGVVLGELLVLRLENGTGIPLSYAVMVVLASSFSVREAMAVIGVAQVVSAVVRVVPGRRSLRTVTVGHRLLVGAVTVAAFQATDRAIHSQETLQAVLLALGAAAIAQLAADAVARAVLRHGSGLTHRGRMAWLALGSSGMLMAIGYRGVDGGGEVGIWGPLLFSTPLLAAWYSFERLYATSRTYNQTIEALSMAPELGGLVRPGHGAQVATLATAVGRELNLSAPELEHLRAAALLHHLGQVILDAPEVRGRPHSTSEVAGVTAGMLREIEPLAAAGDIVAAEPLTAADAGRGRAPHRIAGQVLKVASAFDDLAGGDTVRAAAALEALYSGPGYVYDPGVVAALERVLARERRAVAGAQGPEPVGGVRAHA